MLSQKRVSLTVPENPFESNTHILTHKINNFLLCLLPLQRNSNLPSTTVGSLS